MNFEDRVRGIAFIAGIMDVLEDSWTGVEFLGLDGEWSVLHNTCRHENVRDIPGVVSDRHLYKYSVPAWHKQDLVFKSRFPNAVEMLEYAPPMQVTPPSTHSNHLIITSPHCSADPPPISYPAHDL
jgi:hypothetical protein